VVLCPGASLPLKAWGVENYRACAEIILKKSNVHIVILGGPDESAVGSELAAVNEQHVHNLVAKLSLMQSLAVITKAEYLIAGDSFPGHACDLLGVPATILFGATSPHFGFSPCNSNIRVRWLNLNCSPCTRHGRGLCRFKNHLCMKNIAASDVAQDFFDTMNERKSRTPR
jgi:heptosyltransferase-2